jgi:hypothetical protein
MKILELYHGTGADSILAIMKDGLMKPNRGVIYFVRQESQLHTCFAHGADSSRKAAFAIKLKVRIPDDFALTPVVRPGNPDTWILKTNAPVSVDVLRLFVRKLGEPTEVIEGRVHIEDFLRHYRG